MACIIEKPLVVFCGFLWGTFPSMVYIYLPLVALPPFMPSLDSVTGIAYAAACSWILNYIWCQLGVCLYAAKVIRLPTRGTVINFSQAIDVGAIVGFWVGVEVWTFSSVAFTIYYLTTLLPMHTRMHQYASFVLVFYTCLIIPILAVIMCTPGVFEIRRRGSNPSTPLPQ